MAGGHTSRNLASKETTCPHGFRQQHRQDELSVSSLIPSPMGLFLPKDSFKVARLTLFGQSSVLEPSTIARDGIRL